MPFDEEDAQSTGATQSRDDQYVWRERRQTPRHDIDTELTARMGPDEQQLMRGHSLDISVAGIGGVFATGLQVGIRVKLEFSVPVSTERLRVEAIVRNRSGYRYGFEFVNLDGSQRALIQKTCRVLALLE